MLKSWKIPKKNLGEDSRRRSVLTSVWANLLATKFFSTFGNKQQEDAREMRFSFSLDLFGHMLSIWPEWKKSHKKVKKKGQTYCRPFSSPNNNKNINSFFTGYQTPVGLEYLVSQVLSCLALFGFFYFIFALGGHRILTTIFHPLIFFGDFMNFVCVVVGLFSQLYPATFVLLFSDVIKKKRK